MNKYEKEILEKSKRLYEKSKLDNALRIGNKRLKKIKKKMVYDPFLKELTIKENKGRDYDL